MRLSIGVLPPVMLVKDLPHRVQFTIGRDPFDARDVRAFAGRREHGARLHTLAIHVYAVMRIQHAGIRHTASFWEKTGRKRPT